MRPHHLLPLLLASCASTSPVPLALLETRSLESVDYEAQLAPGAVKLRELDFPDSPPAADPTLYADIATKLVHLDEATAARIFGWPAHAKQALRVDRRAADELLESLDAQRELAGVDSQRFIVQSGELGEVAETNQIAYLERFDLLATDHQVLADPKVGVAEDGILLQVRPRVGPEGEPIELSLALNVLYLERPIAARQASLPGAFSPVTLQLPVTTRQTLRSTARLGPDDALIVGGVPTDTPGHFLFAVVAVDRVAPPPLPEPEPGGER